MGIKGIYREIGPGTRVSLCKLAVDHLEKTGRPLRLAVDISIWQFQVQAARGGANPAIRTLFYRLVRLLGLSIQPIFVFDGPNKPVFKRNKRSGRGDGVATAMAKRLIRLFGFAVHDSPGEAEAECALLQQHGVVDAVLSEDVDTIMFGCGRTLRSWTADVGAGRGSGSKTPTHVSMYDVAELRQGESGLDREGLVLVALMSGGDYLPEGVPGCGVKVACEAAKAGFGKELCQIKKADGAALSEWKRRLLHELRTNESGFFRTKHKALEIPESFPNLEVLRYYTHPVVSQQATVDRLKKAFPSTTPVDIVGLREFVRETFDWTYRIGAVKFIRVLAPSLLVQGLLRRSESITGQEGDLDKIAEEESELVKSITSRRTHFSTDATPELRISHVPADIVGLDLDAEPEEVVSSFGRNGLALNSDDEFENEMAEAVGGGQPENSSKKGFDPLQPDLAWIPETIVKLGAPLSVEDWEAKQRSKGVSRGSNGSKKPAAKKKQDTPAGALDRWVKVTKNVSSGSDGASRAKSPLLPTSSPPPLQKAQQPLGLISPAAVAITRTRSGQTRSKPPAKPRAKMAPAAAVARKPQAAAQTNPWTLAGSQVSPRVTKPISVPSSPKPEPTRPARQQPIIISSSPPTAPSSPSIRQSMSPIRRRDVTPPTASGDPFIEIISSSPPLPRQDKESHGSGVGSRPKDSLVLPERAFRIYDRTEGGTKEQKADLKQRSIKGYASSSQKTPLAYDDSLREDTDYSTHLSEDDTGMESIQQALESVHLGHHSRPSQGDQDDETALGRRQVLERTSGNKAGSDRSAKTKLYVLRKSAVGYYKEVEVARDEADRLMAEATSQKAQSRGAGRKAAILRQSDVSIIDLTGDD